MYLVDIVIVSFNSEKEILDCIGSNLSDEFKYIIIDNSSQDRSVELVRSMKLDNLKLITNDINKGLAAANNQSMDFFESELILILNPDTFVTYEAIKEMVSYMNENQDVSVIGPSTYDNEMAAKSHKEWGQSFGRQFTLLDIYYHLFIPASFKKKGFGFEGINPVSVGWISGHCLMIRRCIFDQINGYDSNFFLSICDVVDLCRRVRDCGQKVHFVPAIKCIHLGSRSAMQKDIKPLALFKTVQGFLYYLRKWHGSTLMYLMLFFVILNHLLKYFIFSLFSLFSQKFSHRALPHLYCLTRYISEGVPQEIK